METPKKQENNIINNNYSNISSSGLKMELVKGKEYASQLQDLLHKPILEDEEAALVQQLAQNVFRSFNDPLLHISLLFESSQIGSGQAIDRASSGLDLGFPKRDVGVKKRRGCYHRRREFESDVKVSRNMDDKYAWRKYGQKAILNSKYPRCYFRCTHKFDQGCRAIKQVQQVDDNEEGTLYQTTYFGKHTCKNLEMGQEIVISDSEAKEENRNMICFQEKASRVPFSSTVEVKQEAQNEVIADNVSSSNVPDDKLMWDDLGANGSEYYPRMEMFHDQEVGSRSLVDLDIKSFDDSITIEQFHW